MESGNHGYRYSLMLVSVLCFGYASGQGQCTKVDSCTCIMEGGGEINLHSLDAGGGNARFTDLFAVDNWYYSYNPCSPFSKGSCSGAAACQSNIDGSESYTIATENTADFGSDGTNVYIAYTGPGDGSGNSRLTTVDLVCDPNAEDPFIIANGESLPLFYSFTLTSKCACPGVCAGNVGPGGFEEGISAGSVLCIIFFSVMIVYAVSGSVFNKVERQAEGKDIIPNVEFWSALPGLIKDGFIFLVFQKIPPSKTYDSI